MHFDSYLSHINIIYNAIVDIHTEQFCYPE
jgi:hypothetical protein